MANSNLEILQRTIEEVKKKLNEHRDLYEGNERAVCSQIVEPTLKSLGWDPQNPSEVRPEVSNEEGRADYVLFQDGKEVLPIEVKKASVEIESSERLRQLEKYAFDLGTSFGVITNGLQWALVKSFEEGIRAKDRLVWVIDLEQADNNSENIGKLSNISKENVPNLKLIVQKSKDLHAAWESIFAVPDTELVSAIASVLKKKLTDSGIALSECEDFVAKRLKEGTQTIQPLEYELEERPEETTPSRELSKDKPTSMSIRGKAYPIFKHNDILVQTAEWLIHQGKIKPDTTFPTGRDRNLIDRNKRYRNGKAFFEPRKLSNGNYIDLNYNARNCEAKARELLGYFGYNPKDLVLRYR